MSDFEVNLVNDNMQEFFVRFLGPEDSKIPLTKHHLKAEYGKYMSNYQINILINHLLSVL